ncbi:protein AF-9 [Zychaea mexicana]|uniref:protein AF-9 n=1 Tax=Zychaea mexicana TaxID=64656 RepID=UPI0022FF31D7|nr:protein AF-9 [Zychaea mexicana]KAI9498071.1 protein AF-9 [Zychaea mexicana]
MASNKRMKGVSVTLPVYTFNFATPLTGKKANDSDHTHKWTIGLRGFHSDLSFCIKKVVFRLHDTYPNPVRTVEEPPFEIHETGWGEFEVLVKVHFHPAANEKAAQLYHHIRLHPYQDDPAGGAWPKDKPVTCFLYDELVFNEPTETYYQILADNNVVGSSGLPLRKYTGKDYAIPPFSIQMEQEELDRLEKAQREVNQQILQLRQRKAVLEQEKVSGN